MAFENVECVRPPAKSAATVPADGVRVTPRNLKTRGGGRTAFIRIAIGAELSRKISLVQPDVGLRVLFGTGADAGKVQIGVDEALGKFRAKRDKQGRYAFTINEPTALGRFALAFPAFTRAGLEAVRPVNGQPKHFVFKASPEMLKVDD